MYDEETDGCELLGVFKSKEEALDAVGPIEEDRSTMGDMEDGGTFSLDDPTSPNIGVMPGGSDPVREFRVLVKVGDEDDADEEAEPDETDYYVLEF
jgi:hypothetical protein